MCFLGQVKQTQLQQGRENSRQVNEDVLLEVHLPSCGRLRDVYSDAIDVPNDASAELPQVHPDYQGHDLSASARAGEGARASYRAPDGEQAVCCAGALGDQALLRGTQLYPRYSLPAPGDGVNV